MNTDGKTPLRTILAHLLGQPQQNKADVEAALRHIASNTALQAEFEQLMATLDDPDEADWLEAVAATLDGMLPKHKAQLTAARPHLADFLETLRTEPMVDLTAGLPAFPTFAAQQMKPTTDATWVAISFDQGRGLKDKLTDQWRQLTISLQGLRAGHTQSPALSGLMTEATKPDASILGQQHIAPDEANFELALSLIEDGSDSTLCQLQVTITLFDRLGDFSGVGITLSGAAATVYEQITDAQGEVMFKGLPQAILDQMQLQVTLPLL